MPRPFRLSASASDWCRCGLLLAGVALLGCRVALRREEWLPRTAPASALASDLAFLGQQGCLRLWTRSRRVASAVALHARAEDPWEVLGLPKKSSRAEVKRRYYELARLYHPDVASEASTLMMQRIIRAAKAALRVSVDPPRKEGPTSEQSSGAGTGEDVEFYVGRSRYRGANWAEYRITKAKVMVSWSVDMGRRLRGSHPASEVKFNTVRRIASRVDLADNCCDLELELLWGSRVQLELLPLDVAAQVEKLVEEQCQLQAQRRARMQERCVSPQPERRGRRYYR
mmetsp:Transcript_56563/g.122252  ORF Transcript_56563/g.122252 Transcript_56563/m.122252 type:complete len:285 (+) Transcript_56563:41-895(+)